MIDAELAARIKMVLAVNLFLQTYTDEEAGNLIHQVVESDSLLEKAGADYLDFMEAMGFAPLEEPEDNPNQPELDLTGPYL